jgi:peptide subunit release factor 1 (eRF1)
MDIDLDMSVLDLDDSQQESLNHRQVTMTCPNGHAVQVRLTRGSGSSVITCPECGENIEPRLPES